MMGPLTPKLLVSKQSFESISHNLEMKTSWEDFFTCSNFIMAACLNMVLHASQIALLALFRRKDSFEL